MARVEFRFPWAHEGVRNVGIDSTVRKEWRKLGQWLQCRDN